MGFTLQLLTNAGSRLVYMALLTLLNQREPATAATHATLLANAHALSAFFTLNAFQYYIARRGSDHTADIAPCQSQFTLIAWLIAGLMALSSGWHGLTGHDTPGAGLTLMAALTLGLPELLFTLATAQGKIWRPLAFYGTQSIFYVGYGVALLLDQPPTMTVIAACLPTFLVSLGLFKVLRHQGHSDGWQNALTTLGYTLRLRLGTLAASAPIIATPPAMAYFLGRHAETARQIPQMLLFSSFVGALAFVMGNVFQHHGRDLLPHLLRMQRDRNIKALAGSLLAIFVLCTVLAWPVDWFLNLLKSQVHQQWPAPWMLYAAMCATAVVVLQWYTTVCLHHARPRPVLALNSLYLLLVCALCATTLWGGLHVFVILAISGAIRSSLNVADFFFMSRVAWRS